MLITVLLLIIKIIIISVLIAAFAALLLLLIGIVAGFYIPKNLRKDFENTGELFADKGHSQIGAHRAGAGIAPENTPMAFDICLNAKEFKVEELEFDLHMTKDGKLIILHDKSLDRTTDATEKYGREGILPSDLTYDEIKSLNPGESFVTDSGEMPFKGLRGDDIPDGLSIPLLEDIIDMIEFHGTYLYSIDIKDKGETGKKAADLLVKLINDKGIANRVIIASFNTDITRYLTKKYPEEQRSMGVLEGIFFYFAYAFNIKLNKDKIPFNVVQLPANQFKVIRCGTERFIRYCHSLEIAVQYWTIDEIDEIKRLSDIGADCIITDVPDKMYKLFNH